MQKVRLVKYFNSTLVRLKVLKTSSRKKLENDFNSTLVRLKVSLSKYNQQIKKISIPLWFD